jgi:hypothetical protein
MFSGAKPVKILFLLSICFFILNLCFSSCVAGNTGLEWVKEYGGNGDDILHSSIITSDNCLVLVGESDSYTQDDRDVYIVKVDLNGNLHWNTTFGDEVLDEDDAAYSVIETDDGYLTTGKISTMEGIGDDVLLCKISRNGDLLWKQHYGGNAWDWGNDLIVGSDSSIFVAATTQSFYGSPYDVYFLKCNSEGELIFKRKMSHPGNQLSSSIIQSSNNRYLILGTTTDITNTESNLFLQSVDEEGDEVWYKEYGEDGKQKASKIIKDGDDFLIIGTTDTGGFGRNDIQVTKIDQNGNIIWRKNYGSPYDDSGENIFRASGSILVTGNTFKDQDESQNQYLLLLDSDGNLTFNQTYGTEQYDKAVNTHPIDPNKYIMTGYTKGNKYDYTLTKISLTPYTLTIQTPVESTYGSGSYYKGANPVFGVDEEIVHVDTHIRYLFTGWTSSDTGGYNGDNNPAHITIKNDVTQVANWQKQYYVDIQKPKECTLNIYSGWYNQGDELSLNVELEEGYTFSKWDGDGPGSYTGTEKKANITVLGPISQTIELDTVPLYSLIVTSKFGNTTGSGTYYAGNWVDFDISPNIVYFDNYSRFMFNEWISPSKNGYNGNNQSVSIKIKNDIIEKASWKKQFFVNISSASKNVNLTKSGWYDENCELWIRCIPNEGYKFSHWIGEGVGSYSGNNSFFLINIKSPINQKAVITEAKIYTLEIESAYGEYSKSKEYYENTNVTINVHPKIQYLTNDTRVVFEGWNCTTLNGFTGKSNPANLKITGDTIQKALWNKQYLVSSNDPNLIGWYDENYSLALSKNKTGLLITSSKKYWIGKNSIQDAYIIRKPVFIRFKWEKSYTNLYFFVAIILLSGSILNFRQQKNKFYRLKNNIKRYVLEETKVSLIDLCTKYSVDYQKIHKISLELDEDKSIIYNQNQMLLYSHKGLENEIKEVLSSVGSIDLSNLAKILDIDLFKLNQCLDFKSSFLIRDDTLYLK